MEEITPKQAKFIQEYLIDLNAKQAAIRAGYSEKTAEQQGSRLLSNVKIQSYIKKKLEQHEIQSDMSKQKILDKLWVMVENNEEDGEIIAMRAIEIINKMMGYNSADKQEITLKEEPPLFSDDDLEDEI